MTTNKPTWYATGMALLIERKPLPQSIVTEAFTAFLAGQFEPLELAAFLTALRCKGETGQEIADAVQILRSKMVSLAHKHPAVLDTCGTGGDGSGTFNISTAVALVVAACGVPVVKHGNRSVSSKSGSADALTALGVPVESGVAWAERTLATHGFAFCLAPHFHPALAHVGPVRRQLGLRTIFNLLGPLLNPAAADYQLLGVGHPSLLDPVAAALALLGTKQAFVVCGHDGLDEVTLTGPTHVRRVTAGRVDVLEWTPHTFGLDQVELAQLRADGPTASAALIEHVLSGADGPARRIVLANAAAGLLAIGQVDDLRSGVERAAKALDTGNASALLQRLREPATS